MSKFTNRPSWLHTGTPLLIADMEPCFHVCEDGGTRLNAEQSAAVSCLAGHQMIQAGAGTGKTSCLVARVQRLQQVYPHASYKFLSFNRNIWKA